MPHLIQTLAIVGVGLIGGSIGLAAKRRGVACRVVGSGRQTASLDVARAVGAIDEGFLDPADAVRRADLVVFCTPVDRIAEQVVALAPGCASGTLLTDAGSTKTAIVRDIEGRLPPGVCFVGGHPLAGSEKRGPEHADARLFENRLTVLTPTSQSDPAALERTATFWRALGSRVVKMTPEDHDRALALTSHLPHLAASALAGLLPSELHELTASGFRDTSRVAAGDPGLWTAIFRHNRHALADAINTLEHMLMRYKTALLADDPATIHTLLDQAKRNRDALGS